MGTLCEQCEHDWDAHVFAALDPKLGGAVSCPVKGCNCFATWSPSPMKDADLQRLDALFKP